MKSCSILATFVAALSLLPFAAASDGGKPKVEKKVPAEGAVGVMTSGKVITVGPDGKTEVKDFGGDIPKEVLDKLPKELRTQMEKGQPGVTGKSKAKPKADTRTSPEIKVETFRFGKVITVGPDGKTEVKDFSGDIPKEVLGKLPKEIQDSIRRRGQPRVH